MRRSALFVGLIVAWGLGLGVLASWQWARTDDADVIACAGSVDDVDLGTLAYQASTSPMVREQLDAIPMQRSRLVQYAYNGCAVCRVWVTRLTEASWSTSGMMDCDTRRCDPSVVYTQE